MEINHLEMSLSDTGVLSSSMSASQFDGLVAGVILCPSVITPREWLPLVIGRQRDSLLADLVDAQARLDAIVSHFNRVAWGFLEKKQPYRAVFANPFEHFDHWRFWVEGFFVAVALNPSAFVAYDVADDSYAAEAYAGIELLMASIKGEHNMAEDDLRLLKDNAADLIPFFVTNMYVWLERNYVPNGPLKKLNWDEFMKQQSDKMLH